jgi:ribonuclease R
LLVHRVLAREKVGSMAELSETAEHISTTERASSDAEKDSTLLKKMEFFMRQLAMRQPEEFRAIVVDVRSYGLVVELPDCMVTGMIHVSSLPDDFYQFDPTRLAFIGRKTRQRFQAGNVLNVIVSRVDAYKRQIDFVPTGFVEEGKPLPSADRSGGSKAGSKGRSRGAPSGGRSDKGQRKRRR